MQEDEEEVCENRGQGLTLAFKWLTEVLITSMI